MNDWIVYGTTVLLSYIIIGVFIWLDYNNVW
jgi:hypothetical protein